MPQLRAAHKSRRTFSWAAQRQPREDRPWRPTGISKARKARTADAGVRLPARSRRMDFANAKRRDFDSRLLKRRCIFFGSEATRTRASTISCTLWKSASPRFSVIFQAKMRFYAKWGGGRLRVKRKASNPNLRLRPRRNNACAGFTRHWEM